MKIIVLILNIMFGKIIKNLEKRFEYISKYIPKNSYIWKIIFTGNYNAYIYIYMYDRIRAHKHRCETVN